MDNLDQFKDYLKLNIDSANGRLQYWHRMKLFFKSQTEFNQETVNKFLANCVDQKLKPSTFNGYMTALKHYSRFLKIEIEFPKQKRPTKNAKDFLTLKEIEEEILPYFDMLFPRDYDKRKLIVRLMFTSGLRPCEVVNLKKNDLNFEEQYILVRDTKDKEDRKTFLDLTLIPLLKKEIENSQTDFIFNITKGYINYIFKQINEKLRYKKHVHSYLCRHAFAHHAIKNGISIKELQEAMGHWDIKMTEEYLTLTDDEVIDSFKKKFKFKIGTQK
jgi:integrase/recombinase XerD